MNLTILTRINMSITQLWPENELKIVINGEKYKLLKNWKIKKLKKIEILTTVSLSAMKNKIISTHRFTVQRPMHIISWTVSDPWFWIIFIGVAVVVYLSLSCATIVWNICDVASRLTNSVFWWCCMLTAADLITVHLEFVQSKPRKKWMSDYTQYTGSVTAV